MSFQAMAWAVGVEAESAGQKLVLLMLANHINQHTGECTPSHAKLADECAMSESCVKAHLRRLAERGILSISARSDGAKSLTNSYLLNMGGGAESAPGQNLPPAESAPEPIGIDKGRKKKNAPSASNPGSDDGKKGRKQGSSTTFEVAKELFPEVNDDVVRDFVAVRNRQRAEITPTAAKGLRREATKAGLTIEQALTICIERNWRGFDARWLLEDNQRGSRQRPQQDVYIDPVLGRGV